VGGVEVLINVYLELCSFLSFVMVEGYGDGSMLKWSNFGLGLR